MVAANPWTDFFNPMSPDVQFSIVGLALPAGLSCLAQSVVFSFRVLNACHGTAGVAVQRRKAARNRPGRVPKFFQGAATQIGGALYGLQRAVDARAY